MKRRLFILALAAFALLFQSAVHAGEILTLGINSYRTEGKMEARYQPLAEYLSSQLKDARVQLLVLDQAEMENAVKQNKLDFVLTNPGFYLNMRSHSSFTGVLATQMTQFNGHVTKGFGGVVFVGAQRNDLARLADLKGQRIAVCGQKILGAYQAQAFEMLQAGVSLPGDAKLIELENQDEIVNAVLSGRADAGFIRTGMIEQLQAEGKLDPARIKVLNRQTLADFPFVASTRLYPEWPFLALPHVNEHTVRKVAAALLALEPGHPAAIAAGIAGFSPPADYQSVEQLARALKLPPYDTPPEFRWGDVWQHYAYWIIGIAALLALLLAAAAWLVLMNRRMKGVMNELQRSDRDLRASYAELQKGEQRLYRAQAIAHLGSWELDLVDNRLVWSDEAYRIFGLRPQEFPATYEAFLEAVHPDDRALVHDAYSKSLQEGVDSYEVHHRIIRRDSGEIRYVHEKCQHVRDEAGKVIASNGMVHDITERKQAEDEARRSKGQLHNIIDVSPIPFAINDVNENISYLNAAFTQTFGYDLRDIPVLEDWWSQAYPDASYRAWVAQTWSQHLEAASQSGRPFEPLEVEIRCKDGTTRTVLASAVPLGEEFSGSHLVILYDITERKKIELVLLEKQQLLTESQQIAHIGSWSLDLHSAHFVWSEETYRIYGVSPDSFVPGPESLLGILVAEDRADLAAWIKACLNGENPGSQEFRIVHPNGAQRVVSGRGVLQRDADGQPLRMTGTVQDITERMLAEAEREKLQAQLLQSQKMESIGHLTGGIAHDFNNMLGAMLGYAELLKHVTATPSPDPQRTQKYIDAIIAAGNRTKELITQMLIFSRPQAAEPSGEAPVTLLQPVVKEVMHLLRSTIASSIELNYTIEDEDLRARIQPVHLHQILMNLAINARDAIGEYGRIDVNLAQREVAATCDACHTSFSGDYVVFTVRDSGQGIPEHLLTKIFDPFFTTKEVGKGTGMGLPVVHGIVHALGGHITVESAAGRGTVVRVLLPTVRVEVLHEVVDVVSGSDAADGVLSGLRIMVVDDERAMASMLQEMLSMHGAHVVAYNKPREALAAFERNPGSVDLVVTDETMPKLSGLDMARIMLRLRPGIPIILCTGYSAHVNEDIARQAGLSGFMYKPVEMPILLGLIARSQV